MSTNNTLEIFLVSAPGLEAVLCEEAKERGFKNPTVSKGGVTVEGDWKEVWRANLEIRGASRVLVRIGEFRCVHLAKLDKLSRRFPWGDTLRADVPIKVQASCKSSRIYHDRAAAQRISNAIKEELGAEISSDAEVCVKARILNDLCTISIDSSGEGLHKRNHKQAVNKAPMRETLASLFLRQCGFDGVEPVVDPMCGSGTFVMEAAEIAAGMQAGRSREFAFEQLATFEEKAWKALQTGERERQPKNRFYGFDRDGGAIKMSKANAERAGVADLTEFKQQAIRDLEPPEGPTGLVFINPPYGGRIGKTKNLYPLYQSLGRTLRDRFQGWRVGLVTNVDSLAKTTELPFSIISAPISHGGISVKVYTTPTLE